MRLCLFQTMFCIIVTGVDSRVIVQSSISSVMSDHQRQQSLKKLRRFKLNSIKTSSTFSRDDKLDYSAGNVDVTLSWPSFVEEQQSSSPPLTSSLPPSLEREYVVPDVSRLDFFRRYSARSRSFRGHRIRGSESADKPVWRLFDGGVERGSAARSRPAADRRPKNSAAVDRWNFGRQRRLTILATAAVCFAVVGLLLTLAVVWIRRRRTERRTVLKL